MKLFENITNSFEGPQGHNEDSYEYYCRSNRPEITEAGLEMEGWFQFYPDKEKRDLIDTFKNDFDAGFFELFLFTLFRKMGYKIAIHPTVPNSTKTPDFIVSGFGEEFYLEAKVSYYESDEERATARRLGSLYKILNKSQISDFFIYLRTVKSKTKKQPRANEIRHSIEKNFNQYDAGLLYEDMNTGKITKPIINIYEDEDIYIEYGPIPKSIEGRGKVGHRAIGIYGQEAKVLNNSASLRKALKAKAGRYKQLDKPYLIAVNAIDMMALDIADVWDCLTGTTCMVPDLIKENGMIEKFRQHDGFFTGRNDKGQNTRVSAALITKINADNWKNASYWIMENEKARMPISLRHSSLVTRFTKDEIIYRTPGMTFGEIIMGL